MKAKLRKVPLLLLSATMAACCGVLVACGEPDAVDVNSIRYDGSRITWDAVEDASKYEVVVDNGDPLTALSTSLSYPMARLGTDFTGAQIQITAYADDKASEPVAQYFTYLPKIEEVTFSEEGVASWEDVDGADQYVVYYGDNEATTALPEYENFGTGTMNISVKPSKTDGLYFTDKTAETYRKTYLAAPANINYDGESITWDTASYAVQYEVYNYGNLLDTVTGNRYDYTIAELGAGDTVEFQVKALGDGVDSFSSAISEMKEYTYLGKLVSDTIQVNDSGALIWPEVEGATSYELKIGTRPAISVETNEYVGLPTGESIFVSVRPVTSAGEGFFSYFSDAKSVWLLQTPDVEWNPTTDVDNGENHSVIRWTPVDGASGHKVRLVKPNGEIEDFNLGAEDSAWAYNFFDVGEYEVSVQAVAPQDNADKCNSAFCEAFKVTRLAQATRASDFITSTANNLQEGVDLLWNSVQKTNKFKLYYGSSVVREEIQDRTVKIRGEEIVSRISDPASGGSVAFSIQALGRRVSEREIILNSLTTDMLIAELTVLAQPYTDNSGLTINGDTATWPEVNGAYGYAYSIGDHNMTEGRSIDLTMMIPDAGTYYLSVCAKGNGREVLASQYTPNTQIVRLAAPSYIRINNDGNEDTLTWDTPNTLACNYTLYWEDAPGVGFEYSSIENLAAEASLAGRTLTMRAMKDDWHDVATHDFYVLSSKASLPVTVTKMAAPTWGAQTRVVGEFLTWSAPNNVELPGVKYDLYDGSTRRAASLDEAQWRMEDLDAGSHNFKVKALAYNDNAANPRYIFIASEYSLVADMRKLYALQEGDVAREAGTNEYVWASKGNSGAPWVITSSVETSSNKVVYSNAEQTTNKYQPDNFSSAHPTATLTFQAQGNNFDTISSDVYTLHQTIRKAPAPGFTLGYYNQAGEAVWVNSDNAYIQVDILENTSPYTTGYTVELVGGTTGTQVVADPSNPTRFTLSNPTAGTYTLRAASFGNKFATDGAYLVQSDWSQSQEIKILSNPSRIVKDVDIIDWTGTGTYGYQLTVYITGEDTPRVFNTSGTATEFNWVAETGLSTSVINKIEICALGSPANKVVGSKTITQTF